MLIQPKLGHYLLIACAILIELEKPQLSSFNCSLPFMSHTDGPQFFVQESGTTSRLPGRFPTESGSEGFAEELGLALVREHVGPGDLTAVLVLLDVDALQFGCKAREEVDALLKGEEVLQHGAAPDFARH